MIFFFKVVTGTVRISPSVLRQVLVTRTTDLKASVMSLTLFQGNVILSLFRDPFLKEPPESGTR